MKNSMEEDLVKETTILKMIFIKKLKRSNLVMA